MIIFILAVSLLVCCVSSALAGEVSITAASDLQYAMKDISRAFETRHPGNRVRMVFGSSGKAFAQIENGAPYDMYFSADIEYPQKLRRSGTAISDPRPYAIGRIVLWATKKSGIDVFRGIDALHDPRIGKIAIANPLHAPYGRIGKEVLEHYGVYDRMSGKLVLGENIQQTAQFVHSGAADVGLVAYSLALAPALANEGAFFLIPASAHREIMQGYVLLKPSAGNSTAALFTAFIESPAARAIFRKYGFKLPNE